MICQKAEIFFAGPLTRLGGCGSIVIVRERG